MGRTLLILREPEIRRVLDMASCVEAVEKAFTAYATGGAELPAVINLDVREHRGEIHVKAGHLRGGTHYAVKIASGFYDNPARGLPQNDGMVHHPVVLRKPSGGIVVEAGGDLDRVVCSSPEMTRLDM